MKNRKDERLLDALDYIDEAYIGETEKYYRKKTVARSNKNVRRKRWLGAAVAIVACLTLLVCAIPLVKNTAPEPPVVIESVENTVRVPAADLTTAEVETAPVYDGSRGLQYEVNEDGKTASFVSFGSCTDEVVYIASTYNGLPVVEMRNQPLYDSDYIIEDNYGSKYVKKIVVSDTVKNIWAKVLDICPNIESIYFGANVEYFKPLFFNGDYGKNFATVEVSPDNPNYSSKGNCIVDLRTKELLLGTPSTVIPDDGSVTVIGFQAFAPARHNLTSIVIPEGVKIIDHGAFMSCDKLESILLPDSLEVIEPSAFASCRSLKTLELGTNLKAFDQMAFHRMYVPTIYYKGTVEQWEAVIKPSSSNVSISVPVICTDGESLSDAGRQGAYMWAVLPEYEGYWNKYWPAIPQPDYGPEFTGE